MRICRTLLFATVLLCGCTIQELDDDQAVGKKLTLSVSIDDIDSKVSYTPQSNRLKCQWAAGDSISVITLRNGELATMNIFTAASGGKTANFSGRFTGKASDPVVVVYPPLTGSQAEGYKSRTLTGNRTGMFQASKGSGLLSFSPDKAYAFSQASNGSYSHLAYSDVMTGTVDIDNGSGSVTLTKHSAILKLSLTIPDLTSAENVCSLTITTSEGTPFTTQDASLSLSSPGVWSTSAPSSSTTLYFGSVVQGSFAGIACPYKKLTAYVPVLPNSSSPALQGDASRKITITVATDWSVYAAVKTIPAKSGSDYSYPLASGTINTLTASLAWKEDADPELTKWVRSINSVADVDVEADKLRKEILDSPSEYNITGTTYYIANDGNDYFNSGQSPSSPFKTLDKVNSLSLNPGDGVLFRRGDLWRGHVDVKNGVTYSAYGTGNKPKIYGSPYDAAKEGSWDKTSVSNVYKYSIKIGSGGGSFSSDVGTLVFNHGDAGCAYKVVYRKDTNGDTWHPDTGESFTGWQDLKRDLDMFHDLNTGYVYLCSKSGKPATRFNSIEMPVRQNLFDVYGNGANHVGFSAVVDNICIKYCGSHGVGTGKVKDITVTNCEIGWIGGSLQNTNHEKIPTSGLSRPVRYGNGVEIYGTCNSFHVAHNYIYQVYDAAISPQYSGSAAGLYIDNCCFENNLIERCVYAIEYWLSVPEDCIEQSGFRNFLIKGNIMRMAGEYGWGYQRFNKESPAIIKTGNTTKGNHATDFLMQSNIIDRGKPTLLNIRAGKAEWLPVCKANVYLQEQGVDVGDMIETNPKLIYVNQ